MSIKKEAVQRYNGWGPGPVDETSEEEWRKAARYSLDLADEHDKVRAWLQ
jgi:hypothetical protein